MSETLLIALIATGCSLVTALFTASGVIAWFTVGPQRRKITIDAAQGAILIQSSVLKDIHEDYDRLGDELGQVKMEAMAREKENEDCREKIRELERSVAFLHIDLDRHGRMAELARRKSHTAIHALGNYELHIDSLLDEMRKHQILSCGGAANILRAGRISYEPPFKLRWTSWKNWNR